MLVSGKEKLRIAYVTVYDSRDIHRWSGLGKNMADALENCGFEVEKIGDLEETHSRLTNAKACYHREIFGKNYLRDRDPLVLKSYARQVERALAKIDYDLVFSPGTIPIAYLEIEKPIVFWTDATFAGMLEFYPLFSNLCRETIRHGNKMEQAALSKCCLAIYSSEWAAASAKNHYQVDPEKIKVVSFGANLEPAVSRDEILRTVHAKTFDPLRLLFVGVEWERKRGELALQVTQALRARGVDAELHITGCEVPRALPPFVVHHGFLSKKIPRERKTLEELYRTSHFLILPSRAECFGVSFAEASAFALPSLATDVGGVSSAVKNGINGQLFDVEAGPEKYCDYIQAQISTRENYQRLALSSYDHYRRELNWTVATEAAGKLLSEFCLPGKALVEV